MFENVSSGVIPNMQIRNVFKKKEKKGKSQVGQLKSRINENVHQLRIKCYKTNIS